MFVIQSVRRALASERNGKGEEFRSLAKMPEANQNFAVSQDTFVSPGKCYEVIKSSLTLPPATAGSEDPYPRALDLGAGAGMSTQILWNLGYKNIIAVDQSREAWDNYVDSQPKSVSFLHLTDNEFLDQFQKESIAPFDAVVVNFAINPTKAQRLAQALLKPNGRLLAPVNDIPDYWFGQSYILYDSNGHSINKKEEFLFQPDVTEGTCQGYWCARKLIDRE
ncbi:hypothetical protein AAMO2058_001495900 [Amorphochlora amoebiformis]